QEPGLGLGGTLAVDLPLGPAGAEVRAAEHGRQPGEWPVVVREPPRPQQEGDGGNPGERVGTLRLVRNGILVEYLAKQIESRWVEPAGTDEDAVGRNTASEQGADLSGDQPGLAELAGGFDQVKPFGLRVLSAEC